MQIVTLNVKVSPATEEKVTNFFKALGIRVFVTGLSRCGSISNTGVWSQLDLVLSFGFDGEEKALDNLLSVLCSFINEPFVKGIVRECGDIVRGAYFYHPHFEEFGIENTLSFKLSEFKF